MTSFWRDASGNLRPVYPCPRCGRDVPIYDDFRLVDLKRLGWSLFTPATYVNWCGHACACGSSGDQRLSTADYVAMTEAPRRGDRRRMAFMLLTVLVYMREGGHNCFRQDPVGFNRILEQFLATVAFTSS